MDSLHCRSRHQEALLKVEPSKKFGKLLNKHVTRFTFSKTERYPQLKPSKKILKNVRWCLPSFNSTSQFSLEFSEVSVTPNFFMKTTGRLLLTFYCTKRVLLMPAHWKENEFQNVSNLLFKVNNGNTRTTCEICSTLPFMRQPRKMVKHI